MLASCAWSIAGPELRTVDPDLCLDRDDLCAITIVRCFPSLAVADSFLQTLQHAWKHQWVRMLIFRAFAIFDINGCNVPLGDDVSASSATIGPPGARFCAEAFHRLDGSVEGRWTRAGVSARRWRQLTDFDPEIAATQAFEPNAVHILNKLTYYSPLTTGKSS